MDRSQIPRGPKGFKCPFWQKPMEQVCHTCPMYTMIRGANPNTGENVDRWDCSLALLPLLLVENAQQQRSMGAAIESFRNETIRAQIAGLNGIGLLEKINGR